MKGNVNPFEPWRPSGRDVPPPVHAARPWRPPQRRRAGAAEEEPPFVEPVDPPVRKDRPKRERRPEPERRRRPQPSTLNPPISELRTDQKVVLAMFFVLVPLGLAGLGWLGGTHLPRVVVTLLTVAVGFTTGLSLAHRRSWYVRLGWMAVGLALAALSGWFVPTTRGVNLWSAYQRVDELHALSAGDVAGYTRGRRAVRRWSRNFRPLPET